MAAVISLDDVQGYLKSASEAELASDYAGAFKYLSAAQTLLAGIPDGSRGMDGGGTQQSSFVRQAVDDAIKRVTRLANAVAGVQTSRVALYPVSWNARDL